MRTALLATRASRLKLIAEAEPVVVGTDADIVRLELAHEARECVCTRDRGSRYCWTGTLRRAGSRARTRSCSGGLRARSFKWASAGPAVRHGSGTDPGSRALDDGLRAEPPTARVPRGCSRRPSV